MLHRLDWKKLLLGLLLRVATVTLVRALGRRPLGDTWGNLFELLLLPGGVVAFLVSPGGVHGPVPWLWVPAIICGNVLFYAAVWVSLLVLFSRHRRSAELPGSNT